MEWDTTGNVIGRWSLYINIEHNILSSTKKCYLEFSGC